MIAKELFQMLQDNPNLPMLIEYSPGLFARSDFHITELKNVTYDTVDCGGIQNKWNEVHMQIWESEVPEVNHAVNSTRVVEIIEAVSRMRPNMLDVEIKIEYGNNLFKTATQTINNVTVTEDSIRIQLGEQKTTCKAKDRAVTEDEKAAACCGPATVPSTKMKVNLSDLVNSNSCDPNGNCC